MTFDEWFERHENVLLGNRIMAMRDSLKKLGKPLYEDAQPQWRPVNEAPWLGSSYADELLFRFYDIHQRQWFTLVGRYVNGIFLTNDSTLDYQPKYYMEIPEPPKE